MTVIFEFRFAIFNLGKDGEILTQRRSGAKPQRGSCQANFGLRLRFSRQTDYRAFELCASATSRLCVNPVKVVKVVKPKNRPCNPLMVNGVKPSQGKSNQLAGRASVTIKLEGWESPLTRSDAPRFGRTALVAVGLNAQLTHGWNGDSLAK